MYSIMFEDSTCEEVFEDSAQITDGYLLFYNNHKLVAGFNLEKIVGFVYIDESEIDE